MTRPKLTGRGLFRAVAPRLELAHRQRTAEITRLRAERRTWLNILHEREWAVEHRELQLIRAGARRQSRYIAERQRKLEAARRALTEAQSRLTEINRSLAA